MSSHICYTALSQTLLTDVSHLAVWNSCMLLCLFARVCLPRDRLQRANGWVFLAVCWLVLRKQAPFWTPLHPTYYGIFKTMKSEVAQLVSTNSKFTLLPLCWCGVLVTFWSTKQFRSFTERIPPETRSSSRQPSIWNLCHVFTECNKLQTPKWASLAEWLCMLTWVQLLRGHSRYFG